MKRYWIMLVVLVFGVSAQAVIQAQQNPEKAAQQAAESWLSLVDSAKYVESWEEAASRHPALVRNPLLHSSGNIHECYVTQLQETRLK
jgi:hypothetical protein